MKKLITFLMMAFAVAIVSCDDKTTEPGPLPGPNTGISVTPVAGEVDLGTAKVNVSDVGTVITLTGAAAVDTQTLIGTDVNTILGAVRTITAQGDVDAFITSIAPIVTVAPAATTGAKITKVDITTAMDNAGTPPAVIVFTVENGTATADHSYSLATVAGTDAPVPNITTEEFDALKTIAAIDGIATDAVAFTAAGVATPTAPAGSVTKTKTVIETAFNGVFTAAIAASGDAIKNNVTAAAVLTTGDDPLVAGAAVVTVTFTLANGVTINGDATTPVTQEYSYTAADA